MIYQVEKIEHGENHISALKRELQEEIGLSEKDFQIKKLLTVEEDFVKHIWQGEEKDEHIIVIIYEVNIVTENFNVDFIENNGDSAGLKLISVSDINFPKTNILKKVLEKKILPRKILQIQKNLYNSSMKRIIFHFTSHIPPPIKILKNFYFIF